MPATHVAKVLKKTRGYTLTTKGYTLVRNLFHAKCVKRKGRKRSKNTSS